MKGIQLNQQLLVPLASPKKMAPFNSNMHYKTNFSIGIPGVPFNAQAPAVQQSYPSHSQENKLAQPVSNQSYASTSNVMQSPTKLTPSDYAQRNSYKPKEALMIEKAIGDIPEKSSEMPPIMKLKVANEQQVMERHSPPLVIQEPKNMEYMVEQRPINSKGSGASAIHSEYMTNSDSKKDAIGLFLPSQYEDAVKKQKEKNDSYLRELTQLKMRRLQEKQEEEQKELRVKQKLEQEWASIGSKEEYETLQYRNHQKTSKIREDYSYQQYQINEQKQIQPSPLHNSEPRDKLPSNYTGKDIIRKMQQNWYKELVGAQRESMFQGVAKQIVK